MSYYFSDNFDNSEHGFIDTLIDDWETLHLVIAIVIVSQKIYVERSNAPHLMCSQIEVIGNK